MARARLWVDPKDAISMLDRAMKLRRSPVCLAARASARAFHAADTRDEALASLALEDAQAATTLLPDSPTAHAAQLYARLVAASIQASADQQHLADEYLRKASSNVQHLKRHPEFVMGRYWSGHYHLLREDYATAMADVTYRGQVIRGFGAEVLVVSAFATGQMTKALAHLNEVEPPRERHLEQARIILLLGIPGKLRSIN